MENLKEFSVPYVVSSYTHIGGRPYQEDRCAFGKGWAVIADGMGGHEKGGWAAELVIGATVGRSDLDAAIAEVAGLMNAVKARKKPGSTILHAHWMGTGRGIILLQWAGDSNAYLQRAGESPVRVTKPHEDVLGRLLNCVGGGEPPYLEKKWISLEKGDALIMVSDGVDDAVLLSQIREPVQNASSLVEMAVEARTRDNATAIVIRRT